ncbi:MAG: FAD-dependent monooxygenase [Acetobacteraceae bacterium]|nr:FAD-dependent monooxygenase [Acetobacteraceae bacterium]
MRVLVVGAGPTGLVLALALRQRGIACRLVDRATEPSRHSKALGVQARTLEVMERLGLAERFLAASLPVRALVLHLNGGGAAPARLVLPEVHPRYPALVSLPQAETERLLLEAGGAAPERGVEFVGLDGAAALLRHADGREERDAGADWIVGCDGAHSAVRRAVGAAFPGERYPQRFILADCQVQGLEPSAVQVFPTPSRTLAFIPLPDGRWRAIAVLPPDAEVPEEPTLTPFAQDGVRLSGLDWYSTFRISHRMATRFRHGRVVLAGDAAHIHSPVGGQGMNIGVQDAWSLAAALAEGEAAVDRWAAEREALARRVLRATDLATRMVTAQGRITVWFRNRVLRTVASRPPLVRRVVRAVAGLNYPAPPD